MEECTTVATESHRGCSSESVGGGRQKLHEKGDRTNVRVRRCACLFCLTF